MPRTTHTVSSPRFVADESSIVRGAPGGRQIDWANVDDSYKNTDGKKVLPAGAAVGVTGDDGQVSPRAADHAPAIGLLETAAVEGHPTHASTGYGIVVGGAVYENLLPDADPETGLLDAAVKAELNAAGTGFAFFQYSDQR